MRSSYYLVLVFLLTAVLLRSQNVNTANPVEIQAQKNRTPEDMRARVSNAQLQKDAKELANLCASIPVDMDAVKQGLLAKDLLEKLKRVEKLSKRVREQLARDATSP